jgi:hypothetical protein
MNLMLRLLPFATVALLLTGCGGVTTLLTRRLEGNALALAGEWESENGSFPGRLILNEDLSYRWSPTGGISSTGNFTFDTRTREIKLGNGLGDGESVRFVVTWQEDGGIEFDRVFFGNPDKILWEKVGRVRR